MGGVARMLQGAARSLRVAAPAAFLMSCAMAAPFGSDNSRPDLPPGCEELEVPSDQDVSLHAYAQGVQIYQWNDATAKWDFVAPAATLYADPSLHGQIGTHYAGPTWETDSGSKVLATKLVGCTPDATAIPWLKLAGVTSEGPGPLDGTTFVQRVETAGGLAPGRSGSPGEVVEVPYTAEYYFYRQH